jgi:hypothetical protein
MVTATFFCLGLAVCIFAGLICYALAKNAKSTVQLPPNERAAWNRLKIAILELYSRYESTETPKQKALRSWAGTLVICAGLCMIGIVLEVRYNNVITTRTVVSSLTGEARVPSQELRKQAPGQVPNKTAARTNQ